MDSLLKTLAEVGLDVDAAEEALDEGAPGAAATRLDAAEEGLAALRERWTGLSTRERALLGGAAGPVRARLDAARARVPVRRTLSVGAEERDPEEDVEPDAA